MNMNKYVLSLAQCFVLFLISIQERTLIVFDLLSLIVFDKTSYLKSKLNQVSVIALSAWQLHHVLESAIQHSIIY